MVEGNKYLVVVSLLEGRNFPHRANRQLSIEARFDGEHLATDPVEHTEEPQITQELAWELDKKSLHQHRLQRSPIKLLCYAIEKTGSHAKEELGYVVLDVRSAHTKQPGKWYPLLHAKYSRLKPELRLSIYAEKDKSAGSSDGRGEGAAGHVGGGDATSSASAKQLDVSQLKPMFNDIDGCYELGPQDSNASLSVLSVTIVSARNLVQLVPSTAAGIAMCTDTEGFYFFYTLLGNDILTQSFLDILKPSFAAERASVRIRSHADVLKLYLENQPPMRINLCSGDHLLASCDVHLNQLCKGRALAGSACSFESTLNLQPSAKIRDQLAPFPDDSRPDVCVTVSLRPAEPRGATLPYREASADAILPVSRQPPQSPSPVGKPAAAAAAAGRGSRIGQVGDAVASDTSYSSHFSDEPNADVPPTKAPAGSEDGPASSDQGSGGGGSEREAEGAVSSLASALTTTSEHTAIPAQPRQFRWSVHLESVSRVEVTNQTRSVYIKYSYPHFGSAAPVMTHPAVEVRKGAAVRLPQSFCAFHFTMTAQQLREVLTTHPLKLEIWEHNSTAGSRLIGNGAVLLQCLLAAVGRRIEAADGQVIVQYSCPGTLKLLCSDRGKAVAQLQYTLTLDDFGNVPAQLIVESEAASTGIAAAPAQGRGSARLGAPSPGAAAAAAAAVQQQRVAAEANAAQPADVRVRQTAEYQAALELEMWKAAQEEAFEQQLEEKERQHLHALAEEWKQRDMEREVLTKKKLAEYSRLEQQVQTLLADVARRDRELTAKEQEVERLRGTLQHDYDCKSIELKEASRRLELDYEHKLELARMKYSELEGQLTRAKQETSEAERKYQSLDREFAAYKEQQHGKTELRLQSEISVLTLEKVELERKLEAASKSKLHYKQQWGRALKELARLKEKEQAEARGELRRRQQELEHMRLRYLAAEEGEVIKSDRKQLDEVKSELQRLKEIEEEKLKMQKQSAAAAAADSVQQQPQQPGDKQPAARREPLASSSLVEDALEERVARLIEERDTLLRTGVYSSSDRIIVELDRQIRDAISRHNAAAMVASSNPAGRGPRP